MKWLEARHLDSWAESTGARERLSEIVAQLVRASAASIAEFDFPTGDSAQTPGYDGRLTAVPADAYRDFLPEGYSVWEWGTGEDCLEKANKDYKKRTKNPGQLVDQPHTTFVFVSARRWDSHKQTRAAWEAEKRAENKWLSVKAFDAGSLEAWFEKCPAVAATVAREILRTLPTTGAVSAGEFWEEYSTQFKPRLREEALLAGREEQAKTMLQALNSGSQIHQWQGDSLAEVLAFMVACIRTSEEKVQKFLGSRLLLLESKDAVRHLAEAPNLIFAVRGEAAEVAGMLRDNHAVIFPLGRDSLRDSSAIRLNRPSSFELAEALKKMDLNEADCQRLALECDRSVTILAHRIPIATPKRPSWYNDNVLVPAFLAGSWDAASTADCAIVARLAGTETYLSYETQIRQYRQREDAPLESEGTVWAIRAPVEVFVNIEHLLGAEHFVDLEEVAKEVFGEVDPSLDLAIEKRPFAKLYDATLPHSPWLREGLANTLLVVAALGGRSGLTIEGRDPQLFVNRTIASIPALRDNHRVLTSLSHELPLLMEAAPGPLLFALEQLLEGDGHKLLPIFQDKEANSFLFTRSPHTGFLWALEMIAWDPTYLPRASFILLKLSKIDPGGSLGNRPLKSLLHIFLPWLPATNAPLEQRIVVLDQLLEEDETTAWKLLVELLPGKNDTGSMGPKPRFRESGASEHEVMTYALRFKSYCEIIRRAVAHAGNSVERWQSLVQTLHTFPPEEQQSAILNLETHLELMNDSERTSLCETIAETVRHHKAYSEMNWSLSKNVADQLDSLRKRFEPNDPIQQSMWLFEERFPTLPRQIDEDFFKEVERLRRDAIRKLLDGGIGAVLNLAARAKAQRFVGYASAYVVKDVAQAKELLSAALILDVDFDGFASFFSLGAIQRFEGAWRDTLSAWQRSGSLGSAQLAVLALAWPHNQSTWSFLRGLGPEFENAYWERRPAWGIEGDEDDLTYAVEQYLKADRAELIVLGLSEKVKEVPGPLLLATLDQFDHRIRVAPNIRKQQNLEYDLEQFFSALADRKDVTAEQIAVREYRYLPLLRTTRVFSRGSHSLALDKFMAESPELFVKIICDVFGAESDRGKEKAQMSEDARARAYIGWTLLDGFTTIPGFSGDQVDIEVLKHWVSEVEQIAAEADRLTIAQQKIGTLLAHSPNDPEDNVWPHRGIRECLDNWRNVQIERGISIERLNMRGGNWRAPREGGQPERILAAGLREAASKVSAWPRTRMLLLGLADHWEETAKQEDIRSKQDEMRE